MTAFTSSADGASRGATALFAIIPTFGIAAAIAMSLFGGSVQPLGSPAAQLPAVTAPVAEPDEPAADEPAPAPEPSTEPVPEPEPEEPVEVGLLGIALVEEFGPDTTFWRDGEQVENPVRGDTFRSSFSPSAHVGQMTERQVGTETFWTYVLSNSESEGLEGLVKYD